MSRPVSRSVPAAGRLASVLRPAGLIALAALASVATLAVMGKESAASVPAPAGRLGSTVFRWADLPAKTTGTGLRRDVTNGPTATLERLECHVSTLNPGRSSHPPHRHPQEEFIVVREGTLDVFINGVVQRAGPGSLLFFASNDLHNMTNAGTEPATYEVFQITTAATHTVPDRPAAEWLGPKQLHSAVFNWEKLAVKPTRTGERRDFVDAATATCVRFECHATTINAGEAPHAAHHHPDEEFVLVRQGDLAVTINGATTAAGPGSIVFFSSNDEHGMRNSGNAAATYHVIRLVTAATPVAAVR